MKRFRSVCARALLFLSVALAAVPARAGAAELPGPPLMPPLEEVPWNKVFDDFAEVATGTEYFKGKYWKQAFEVHKFPSPPAVFIDAPGREARRIVPRVRERLRIATVLTGLELDRVRLVDDPPALGRTVLERMKAGLPSFMISIVDDKYEQIASANPKSEPHTILRIAKSAPCITRIMADENSNIITSNIIINVRSRVWKKLSLDTCLDEEIFQALGAAADTATPGLSMFEDRNIVQRIGWYDCFIIVMLYSPYIRSGMEWNDIMPLRRQVISYAKSRYDLVKNTCGK